MLTDPILHLPYAISNHAELIRQAERERAVATVHPWYSPFTKFMAAARASVGAMVVRLGQRIQGTAKAPAPATW